MQYVKNFFCRNTPGDFSDPLGNSGFYQKLNWAQTVIGGSYALHQFTGDNQWQPSDVDVFYATDSLESFKTRVAEFVQQNETIPEDPKIIDFTDPVVRANRGCDEDFHDLVKASVTMTVADFPEKQIQFIYLDSQGTGRTPESILAETTDLPSCVCYSVDPHTGNKVFHIPEKGRQALLTRQVPLSEACPSRVEKYAKRGFQFY